MYDKAVMDRMRKLSGTEAAQAALDRAFDLIHIEGEMTKSDITQLCFWVGAAWGFLQKAEKSDWQPPEPPKHLTYPTLSDEGKDAISRDI